MTQEEMEGRIRDLEQQVALLQEVMVEMGEDVKAGAKQIRELTATLNEITEQTYGMVGMLKGLQPKVKGARSIKGFL